MSSPSVRLFGALALAALLTPAHLASQTTVTIEPDRDNSLYEDAGGTLSNGSGSRIFAAVTLAGTVRRALLHFDIAGSIPPGAVITDVELRLFSQMRMGGNHNLSIHRVSQDWGEGASVASGGQGGGGIAVRDDATWTNTFFPNQNWNTPGGDFNATPSVTTIATAANPDPLFSSNAQFVADAQSFLDQPTTNFGWLMKTDEVAAGDAAAYGSREASAGNRPQLVVTYTGGSQAANIPFGTACSGSGSALLTLSGTSLPTVPNAGYALQLTGGPSATIGSFIGFSIARSPVSLPIPFFAPGCFLEIDLVTFLGDFPLPASGVLNVPIPNDPNLLGNSIMAQGFAAELSLAIASSNGLEILFDL